MSDLNTLDFLEAVYQRVDSLPPSIAAAVRAHMAEADADLDALDSRVLPVSINTAPAVVA